MFISLLSPRLLMYVIIAAELKNKLKNKSKIDLQKRMERVFMSQAMQLTLPQSGSIEAYQR
ncbi:MAG: hypothetical protein ACI9VL_001649, partial [Colwellia sp.]